MAKVAIVTGASRGIGAAVARLLGANGYAVCVNYRAGKEAAERMGADIAEKGGRAIAVAADVARIDEVRRLFETVDQQLGIVTALVNNAGIHGPRIRVDELAVKDLQQVIGINVVGLITCSQEAVRRMSMRHGGSGGAICEHFLRRCLYRQSGQRGSVLGVERGGEQIHHRAFPGGRGRGDPGQRGEPGADSHRHARAGRAGPRRRRYSRGPSR